MRISGYRSDFIGGSLSSKMKIFGVPQIFWVPRPLGGDYGGPLSGFGVPRSRGEGFGGPLSDFQGSSALQ